MPCVERAAEHRFFASARQNRLPPRPLGEVSLIRLDWWRCVGAAIETKLRAAVMAQNMHNGVGHHTGDTRLRETCRSGYAGPYARNWAFVLIPGKAQSTRFSGDPNSRSSCAAILAYKSRDFVRN